MVKEIVPQYQYDFSEIERVMMDQEMKYEAISRVSPELYNAVN
jgi:hypothetical protein